MLGPKTYMGLVPLALRASLYRYEQARGTGAYNRPSLASQPPRPENQLRQETKNETEQTSDPAQ